MAHTRSFRLFLVPLAMLLAVVGVTGAAATPLPPASGTFTYTSATFSNPREVGGNLIVDLSATVEYEGTLEGTSTVNGTLIFHANGTANYHDVEVFTGSVNGVPGTLTFRISGSMHNDIVQGTTTIVSGTGGLSTLRGVLHLTGTLPSPTGPEGTYTGVLQSTP
jgi:hypothetical protein